MPYQPKTPWDYTISGVKQGAGMGPQILQTLFQEKALESRESSIQAERDWEREQWEKDQISKAFSLVTKGKTPGEVESYKRYADELLDRLEIGHGEPPSFTPSEQETIQLGDLKIPVGEAHRYATSIQEELAEVVSTPQGDWKLVTSKTGEQYWEDPNTGQRMPSIGYQASQGKTDVTFANETTLRKEFTSLPVVKNWTELDRQFQMMEQAFAKTERMTAGKEKPVFGPADQALIIVFNKMLDPTSVVRESEFARTPEQMAMWQRLKARADRIMKGGVLSPDERRALVDMAKEFHKVYKQRYDETAKEYRGYAKQYGLSPNRIVKPVTQGATQKAVTRTGVDRNTGRPVIQYDDGSIEYAD